MSPSAADVLNVARSYLGVREIPDGSNQTIIGEKFGWNGVAWCAEGVSVDMLEAGVPFDKSASCSQLIARYESGENGAWLGKPDISEIRPGDEGFLGTHGQDHTWLVEAVDVEAMQVHCIDDNWGNMSQRVTRPYGSTSIFGFGRPNYDGAAMPDIPPPSATQGRAILRKGSSGEAVGQQQAWLNTFHNAGLVVDNDFGDATEAAVIAFQQANGLRGDGEVGPDTYAVEDRIVAWCAAQGNSPPMSAAPEFPGTIVLGSHGPAVEAFQRVLRERGWPIVVDSVDGKDTTNIIEQYQAEKGLKRDGIGGPLTWVSLCTAPVTP